MVTSALRKRRRAGPLDRRRMGGVRARKLAGLRRQTLGRRRQDGDPARQHLVAQRAVGRGRPGGLDQLVHQARGGPARARRSRSGQDLQARASLLGGHAAVRRPQIRACASRPRPPAARSAATRSSGTTSSWPPRSARSGRSSTAWATSASRSTRPDKAEMRFYNGFSIAEMGDPYGPQDARHREAEPDRGAWRPARPRRRARRRCHERGRVRQHGRRSGGPRAAGHGRLPVRRGRRHLLRFGWESHWSDPDTYNAVSRGSAWTSRAGSPTTSKPA